MSLEDKKLTMPLRFEEVLNAVRDKEGLASIYVTITVIQNNGIINGFRGALHYSNKKQDEFISEETLSTSLDQPLQHCSSFIAVKPQASAVEQLQNEALIEIDFSISNNLIESRIGLLRFSYEENKLHVIKFEEKGSFLIGIEVPTSVDENETLHTIAFTNVITYPVPNVSNHF